MLEIFVVVFGLSVIGYFCYLIYTLYLRRRRSGIIGVTGEPVPIPVPIACRLKGKSQVQQCGRLENASVGLKHFSVARWSMNSNSFGSNRPYYSPNNNNSHPISIVGLNNNPKMPAVFITPVPVQP